MDEWNRLYKELFEGWGKEENRERDKAVVRAFKEAFPPKQSEPLDIKRGDEQNR